MPNPTQVQPKSDYDSRWLIWTIVFLVAAGISLASYIVFSGTEEYDVHAPIVTHQLKK